MTRLGRLGGRRSPGQYSPALESAARAKRARDHLSRKRERERVRLERARHRQEIRRGRLRLLGVLTPILCFGAAVVGARSAEPLIEQFLLRDTPIASVTVQGTHILSARAVAASAGALAGVSLGAIDPDRVGEQLMQEPWVASARALRLPGGTLVLRVVERQAIARFADAGAGASVRANADLSPAPDSDPESTEVEPFELVDPSGQRFAGALPPGGRLPLIRGAAVGTDAMPTDALEILQAITQHARLGADPAALTLHLPESLASSGERPTGYVLELGPAGPRALLGRRLFAQRVARLAALLEEDESMVESAQLIDLRYADRLVLQTAPTSG